MQNPKKPHGLIILACLLIIGGAYALVTALSPLLISPTIDPEENPTTKVLKSTETTVTEQRLYIPKLNVNVPYNSGEEVALERGAWWRQPQNGNPKEGGNFVLSAHRFIMGLTPHQTIIKSPFYHIDKLGLGDKIIVDYEGVRYTYLIKQIFDVQPDAIEIERRTEQPQLTLYSCTFGGSADGRDVIVATLTDSTTNDEL